MILIAKVLLDYKIYYIPLAAPFICNKNCLLNISWLEVTKQESGYLVKIILRSCCFLKRPLDITMWLPLIYYWLQYI